jgi:hypothetical protein
MKYKWQARAFGAFQTVIFSALYSPFLYFAISSEDTTHRILAGLVAGFSTLPAGLGVIDGVTDIVKGTHHYFGLKLYKQLAKMTGHIETAEKIQSAIDFYLECREKDYPFFRRKQE